MCYIYECINNIKPNVCDSPIFILLSISQKKIMYAALKYQQTLTNFTLFNDTIFKITKLNLFSDTIFKITCI